MRTGAIFARGSCRALKWMALFGVVFALGAGSAAAQATFTGAEWTPESDQLKINMSAAVWSRSPNDAAKDFTVTWGTPTVTATGTTSTLPDSRSDAATEFIVTLDKVIPTGAGGDDGQTGITVTYTAPTDAADVNDRGILDNTAAHAATATGNPTVTENTTVAPMVDAVDAMTFKKGDAITAFQLPAAKGNQPFTYLPSNLPSGLTWDADGPNDAVDTTDDREISGTPDMVTDGAHMVTYTVTDRVGQATSITFMITVNDVPDVPEMLTATPTTNMSGSLTVTWDAPADNNSDILYHQVQYKPTADMDWMAPPTNVLTGTSHTFTGLTDGTSYDFQVRAINGVGMSPWSATAMGTPMASEAVPARPAAPMVTATANTHGSLDVTWVAPADNGSAIIGYLLRYRVKDAPSWTEMIAVLPATPTSTKLPGMLDNTTYEVQVKARNGNGDSVWSESGEGATLAPPPGPDVVRGQITAMKITQGSSGSSSTEVLPQIMVGGTNRYHVKEGWNDVWLAVTVRWTHKEIAEMAGAAQYVHVEIMGGVGLPIPGVHWVSWIDEEGDADFPQGDTLGRLQARVMLTPPRTATPAGSERHFVERTGYVRVLLPMDQHEAENDAFFIEATGGDVDLRATAAVNTTTPVVIIEDRTPQTVSVARKSGEPSVIYEGAPGPPAYGVISSTVNGQALYTVTAKPPRVDLPLEVRMDLLDPEGAVRAGDVSLSHSVVTLNPNMDAMGNSQDMYLSLPYPDGDRVDDHYKLQASVVVYSLTSGGEENTETPSSTDITVYDRHKLPWLTVSPVSGVVTEGDEDGIDLELTVNRNPANTIATNPEIQQYTTEALTIAVDASGSSNFTMTPSSISVDEYKHTAAKGWMQKVKVKITAENDEDIEAETLMLEFAVNGTMSRNGKPRPSVDDGVRQRDYDESMAEATLTIQDATNALVSVRENAYDVIKGALGDPPMLTTGMSAELMGSNLFDYDPNAVDISYGTPETTDRSVVSPSASGGAITLMAVSAGEAKITITATATPKSSSLVVNQTKANVAQLTFPVMVEDEDLVFMVSGPDDMNLAEGGMGGLVTVTTNRPVTENTEVMLMRDGSSSASEDDYTLEPPLVTIMAGHEMGSTMVMATKDGTTEDMETLTLFLVVDGMQMTDKSVSFYLWDDTVPALPVIAQLLLAAIMAIGGYRRYRRR